MPRKHYWWADLPGERYWCEITDRSKPGDDLLCPQTQEGGKPYWSYSLILQIRPGDIIFHYYTPLKAFVGASVATGVALPDKMSWVPHGTVGRGKKEHAVSRPAWRLPISGYVTASTPLTLTDVQKDEVWVRKWIAEKQTVADVVAAPFQPYPGKLRGYQGYLTKMPLAFVNRWPRLKELADDLSGNSYVRGLAAELQDDDAVLTAVLEDVRQLRGQGFQVNPKARRAIEDFAVQRAKRYYEAQGYSVEVRGKPYDLLCSKGSNALHVEVYALLAALHTRRGEKQKALDAIEEATRRAVKMPNSSSEMILERATIAETYLRLLEMQGAESKSFRQGASKACKALGGLSRVFPIGRPFTLLWSGLCSYLGGNSAKANAAWTKSLSAAKELQMLYAEGLAEYELGRHLQGHDQNRKARLQRASDIFRRVGAARELSQAEQALHAD